MAYFIDAELNALTTGKARPAAGSPRVNPGKQKRANKFGKKCHGCSTWVQAGEGYLDQVQGAWVVYCKTCP